MKDIKIGKILFTRKAILLIAFCLFLNGMTIGAIVAYKEVANDINFLIIYIFIFMPYFLFFKNIKKHIVELE